MHPKAKPLMQAEGAVERRVAGLAAQGSGAPEPAPIRGSAPFRAQARLIRLLGEELISDEVMALLELVKNAYDADARRVVIGLRSSSGGDTDSIEIRDDGDGMQLETILNTWLEPATRRKRGGAWKQRTPLGRFPLGEKGVGRFAADKLGGDLELVTRARGEKQEAVVRVGWNRFEADAYLDEIESHWEVRPPLTFLGDTHGTSLLISSLRASWNVALVEKVRNGLARLISPAADARDFTIILDCPELPELCGPVRNRLLDRAPYTLRGWIDAAGMLHPDGSAGEQPSVNLCLKAPDCFQDGSGSPRDPLCGPFGIALYAWDLDLNGLRSAGMDRTMRNVLKQWSGVSIYRDSFRVLPYGEKDDDWLELNQRRVNNPTLRLSNNQVLGIIEITQRDNPDLRDRTSREGMIDTPALADFRQLVLGALAHLEEQRFSVRRRIQDDQRLPDEEQNPDPVLRMIEDLRGRGAGAEGRSALGDIERAYRSRLTESRSREDSLLRLVGIGVAAERMTGELAAALTSAMTLTDILRNHAAGLPVDAARVLSAPLQQLEGLLAYLEDQLDILTPLRDDLPNGNEYVDMRAVVQDAIAVFGRRFRSAAINVSVTGDSAPVLFARRGHLMQVVLALFDNSFYWLRHTTLESPPAIRVHLWSDRRYGGLIVADNGPGISPGQARLIFEPSYTTRREGLGLGLFIVRTLLERYEASISLLDVDRLLPGANLLLRFRLPRQEI